MMTTHFITAEIDLQETSSELQEEIQNQLEKHGQTLRWAVTKIDQEKQKATIEAVITKES